MILRRLVAAIPSTPWILRSLEAEHEEGGREVQLFLRAVVRLVLEPDRAPTAFWIGRALIEHERRTWLGGKNFFQLAEQILRPEDWTAIEARLKNFSEPLQQRLVHERFSRLGPGVGLWRSALGRGGSGARCRPSP